MKRTSVLTHITMTGQKYRIFVLFCAPLVFAFRSSDTWHALKYNIYQFRELLFASTLRVLKSYIQLHSTGEKSRRKKFHNLFPFIRRVIFVVDNSSSTHNYSRMSSNIERRFKDPVIYRSSRRTRPDCVPLNFLLGVPL